MERVGRCVVLNGHRLVEVGYQGTWKQTCFRHAMSVTATQTTLADALQARFIDFGAKITGLVQKLPRSPAGTHYARQMLRSGTAAAPNYAEARSAESRADFIHKMRIVLKELNETAVWLRMAVRSELFSRDVTSEILAEAEQLCRIVAASIRTAKSPQRQD